MGKLLPIILLLVGLGGGVGAGLVLRPPPPEPPAEQTATEVDPAPEEEIDTAVEFVKLNNQFVVPVVEDGRVQSMVVLSVTIETKLGQRETIYQFEPKLRDAFLRVLFDHANAGGFHGTFTANTQMNALRVALLEIARRDFGTDIYDVLITDIVRQDNS